MAETLLESEIEDLESMSATGSNSVPMDLLIQRIKASSTETLKANSKVAGISLEQLKNVATHLGMSKTLAKGPLVDAIKSKLENKIAIEKISAANEELKKKKSSFKYNQNTNPRILNLLTKYPDGLLNFNMVNLIFKNLNAKFTCRSNQRTQNCDF
jgi:hypothetical protein